jgi:HAD superfamily phosphoserine phosphatase-like hydrolase
VIVVFDFDKTLINEDSLFGFYKQVHGDTGLLKIKRYFLLMCALLYKMKLLNNTQLKRFGVYLFLSGKSEIEIMQCAQDYAKKLHLNDIHQDYFLKHQKNQHQCFVVSAGFSEYISMLYPEELVLASKLAYRNGAVIGIESNLYGKNKVAKLRQLGYNEIDVLYTDSFADKPLMTIAKQVFIVKQGKVVNEIAKQN